MTTTNDPLHERSLHTRRALESGRAQGERLTRERNRTIFAVVLALVAVFGVMAFVTRLVIQATRPRASAKSLLLALTLLGCALLPACHSVPQRTVTGIGILTSNTHTLSEHYRRVLDGRRLASVEAEKDEADHDRALMDENDPLADSLNTWALKNAANPAKGN